MSYDLTDIENNDRNYVRSMFERFHWRRLGGSVFRYDGVIRKGVKYEDWLNHIVPALMFFRSFVRIKRIRVKAFTIDAASISFLDRSDPELPLGTAPLSGAKVKFATPTNTRCSVKQLRAFIDACEEGSA